MKTVIFSLLAVTLLLFCSSRCNGEEHGGNSESSAQQRSFRSQPEEPTDPQAIREILQRYLSAQNAPHSLEFYTVQHQGDPILPYIIEAAAADHGEDLRVYGLLSNVLRMLSEDARREAAPRLLELLTDEDASIYRADGVLTMIASLGKPGLVIESELIEFRQKRPDLDLSADYALIGIGSTLSGSIYAKRLAEKPGESLLNSMATRGAQARDAGPEVVKLLDHPNWDLRLAAARTLGRIGYTEAIPALTALLNEPTDVRINRVAAESLGRLGDPSAVEALRQTAVNHWHPTVRDEAQSALEHIVETKPYESNSEGRDPFLQYFDTIYWGIKSSAASKPEFLQEPPESKLYKSAAPEMMRELSYESEVIGIGPDDEEERRAARERGATIVVRDDGLVEYRTPIQQVPDVALRVENGWLVGSDRGEWGGELVFVADDGQRTYVLKENVNDLFKLGRKYLAVTGLSHLNTNRGLVYEVKLVESGRWFCELWRALPGAPRSCGKLPSGDVFIGTGGGGNIILAQDGTFTMASPEPGTSP